MPWKYAAQSAIADVIPAQLLVESNYVNRILSSIAFTLLYYDFVLTFRQEVERYWSGTLSWPSFLFFLNRYMSIMSHIPVIVEFFGIIPESRIAFQQYHRVISMVIQAVVAALLLLRTYALYGRDRRILKLLLAIVGVGAIISVWVIIKGHGAQRPTVMQVQGISQAGCDLTLSQEEYVHTSRASRKVVNFLTIALPPRRGSELAIAWSAILVFDGTVVVLTLLQALKVGRAWRGGYYRVMLRDGTIYFGVLFVCYLSNILAYAVAEPVHKGVSTSITNVMSTTLIARLMLNIRNPDLYERPRGWGLNDLSV
ncbi:hypothetical protein BD414DRAFT_540227 [Trametes punicea]|nr:hypothetical protein BD414DRAFT_540227 [Trametes punicea]